MFPVGIFVHVALVPAWGGRGLSSQGGEYRSRGKNAGYFGNSEQPAFKPTHYLKINIISPAKTAAIMGFPTMTVSHLIIRVFFGI